MTFRDERPRGWRLALALLAVSMAGAEAWTQEAQVIQVELRLDMQALTADWDDVEAGRLTVVRDLVRQLPARLPHWNFAQTQEPPGFCRLVFDLARRNEVVFILIDLEIDGRSRAKWNLSPVSPRDSVADLWGSAPEDVPGWILKRMETCAEGVTQGCGQLSRIQATLEDLVPIGRGGRWLRVGDPLIHLPLARSRHEALEERRFRLECMQRFADEKGRQVEQKTRVFAEGIRRWLKYRKEASDTHLVARPTRLIAGGKESRADESEKELYEHTPREIYLACLDLDEEPAPQRVALRGRR